MRENYNLFKFSKFLRYFLNSMRIKVMEAIELDYDT